jgi:signal transduction histidine kinase
MFTTLRSRLWLSYALVIGVALSAVSFVLLIYLIRNPSTYRQESARLAIVSALLRRNESELKSLPLEDLQLRISKINETYGTRVIVFSASRKVILDSAPIGEPAIQLPRFPRLRPYSVLMDASGQSWLYMLYHVPDGRWLLILIPRPAVPFLAILGDELLLPILGAGFIALLVSLLLALWFSRWIGNPLQQMVSVAGHLPAEDFQPVSQKGPHEVRELAQSFNAMNKRLLASQKAQRDLVANVSHEMKTPLTSIMGFSQSLLDGTSDSPLDKERAAQVILDESSRMHRMVLDLLDLAKLDSGTFDLHMGQVDIASVIGKVIDQLTPQAQDANVKLIVNTDQQPIVLGDGDRLAQVFTNLLDNAIKFTQPGGMVTIFINSTSTAAQVELQDTGMGIPPQALPHIFERFYQVDASRQGGRKHGTGLGLAIASEIIAAHGGKIAARSEPGQGSLFIVSLPLIPPGASSTKE